MGSKVNASFKLHKVYNLMMLKKKTIKTNWVENISQKIHFTLITFNLYQPDKIYIICVLDIYTIIKNTYIIERISYLKMFFYLLGDKI